MNGTVQLARERIIHRLLLQKILGLFSKCINDDVRMFVDSGIEDPFKKMTGEMYHEHIEENAVDEIERDLVAAHRKLDRFSEAFDCNCTNGCTATSPWKLWTKPSTRKRFMTRSPSVTTVAANFASAKDSARKRSQSHLS
ncbi:Protein CBG26142 [Caenorhabditis briggsae]|nr:Protein CBG26142 [Caenorhabditis briggsae]CAR99576.1 Protein CBG26142 [Caenorhabditis briggsae]